MARTGDEPRTQPPSILPASGSVTGARRLSGVNPMVGPPTQPQAPPPPAPEPAPRYDSDLNGPIDLGRREQVRRALATLLPSSWAWLMIAIWWTWRALATDAVGLFERPQPLSHAALGIVGDAALVFAEFAALRAVVRLASPEMDPRVLAARTALLVGTLVLWFACTLHIVDMAYCAVEHLPPGMPFWTRVLAAPDEWLLSGATFAVMLAATAIAALARFCLASDVEHTRRASDGLPVALSTGLVVGVGGAALAVALGIGVHGSRQEGGTDLAGRVPEVHAVLAFSDAVALRRKAAAPHLEP
jgi:hypothetical protein